MRVVLGLVALVVGLVGVAGQFVSVVDFPLAQRLGFQEKADGTDALYIRLESNTARWDLMVLWTLPVAGVLMLLDHRWWPAFELLAGAVTLDTGGREAAKILGLRAAGVRVGEERETRIGLGFLVAMAGIGLVLAAHAFTVLL